MFLSLSLLFHSSLKTYLLVRIKRKKKPGMLPISERLNVVRFHLLVL